jgi:hypothetical protein
MQPILVLTGWHAVRDVLGQGARSCEEAGLPDALQAQTEVETYRSIHFHMNVCQIRIPRAAVLPVNGT